MSEVNLTVQYSPLQKIKHSWKKFIAIVPIITLVALALYANTYFQNRQETRARAEGRSINVKDYGAKGDGTVNDSSAIQSAINAAALGDTVLIPPGKYLVNSTINLKSGIAISGYEATLYMPPKPSVVFILNANSTKGVTISGIKMASDATNERSSSLVMGIGAENTGSSDLTIKDIQTENLSCGIKIGTGGPSYRINISNWIGRNDDQNLFLANVKGGTFTNLNLNALTRSFLESGYKNHNVYLEKLNDGLVFENLRVSGATGQSIHLYHESAVTNNGKNITFNNVILDNSNSAIVVWGYDNVIFKNLVGIVTGKVGGVEAAFQFNTSNNVKIDGFDLAGATPYAFMTYSNPAGPITNVSILNGTYHQQQFFANQSNISGLTSTNIKYSSTPFVMPPVTSVTSSPAPSTTLIPTITSLPTSSPLPTTPPSTPTVTRAPSPTVTIEPTERPVPLAIKIISPIGGRYYSSSSLTVKTSINTSIDISKVDFYVDGRLNYSDRYYPYGFKWYLSRLSRGSHTLKATVYDVNGNSASNQVVIYKR